MENSNPYSSMNFINNRSIPLALKIKVMFGGFTSQFGWIFFGFGMIFVFVFVMNIDFSDFYLGESSPVAQARVISAEATNSSVNKRRIYACKYEFTTPDGQKVQGTSYTTGGLPNPGDIVEVEYLATKPSYSRIKGMDQGAFPIFVLFVLIFPLIGLIFIITNIFNALKAFRILKDGVIAYGQLVRTELTNTRINNNQVVRYFFEFTAQDGQKYEAKAETHNPYAILDERKEMIFYDSLDPKKAVIKDSLPGHPRLNDDGSFVDEGLASALVYLILPAITMLIFVAYYFISKALANL
jgi:hypothetical protein